MQNAMQQLSHKSEDEEFNPVANPYYPGANFSNSFGNFLLAQQENPELQSAGAGACAVDADDPRELLRGRSRVLGRW